MDSLWPMRFTMAGDALSPAYYLMATAVLSVVALGAIRRRGPRAEGR
jgi:MYXO-CTERM domain-containing protein